VQSLSHLIALIYTLIKYNFSSLHSVGICSLQRCATFYKLTGSGAKGIHRFKKERKLVVFMERHRMRKSLIITRIGLQ
jgi:hypothetical protein